MHGRTVVCARSKERVADSRLASPSSFSLSLPHSSEPQLALSKSSSSHSLKDGFSHCCRTLHRLHAEQTSQILPINMAPSGHSSRTSSSKKKSTTDKAPSYKTDNHTGRSKGSKELKQKKKDGDGKDKPAADQGAPLESQSNFEDEVDVLDFEENVHDIQNKLFLLHHLAFSPVGRGANEAQSEASLYITLDKDVAKQVKTVVSKCGKKAGFTTRWNGFSALIKMTDFVTQSGEPDMAEALMQGKTGEQLLNGMTKIAEGLSKEETTTLWNFRDFIKELEEMADRVTDYSTQLEFGDVVSIMDEKQGE